jgi:hypothetical protein
MGLDQFARAEKDGVEEEIFSWRKHADLQGWMEDIYREKGGEGVFNMVPVVLTEEDISRLEQEHEKLETATGFFWGASDEAKVLSTKQFISIARERLSEGWKVIYNSWW